MKKYFISIVVYFIFVFTINNVYATDQKVLELSKQKLPELIEPNINIKTLPNGLKVYYLQDDELPVFKLSSYFEIGTVYESKEQRGITDFFMLALNSGGSKEFTPQKIDEEIEFLAAKLTVDTSLDLSSYDLICLQKDVQKVLEIYFDIVRHPRFDKDRIEVVRKNLLNKIKLRNEKALDIAIREFAQSLYGKDSPYAWSSTPQTINAINQTVLQKYYDDHIAPNRIWIAASSPLPFNDFLKLLNPFVSDWDAKLPSPKYPPDISKTWDKSTEFINKESNQSAIVMGHFGEKRFNKDKYKIILADEILGGSTFGSKLGDHIRTDLGLAYSIQSDFGFDREYAPFQIITQTKTQSTVRTVKEIQKILKDMVENLDISNDELDLARERLINQLIFQYDDTFDIVTMRLTYDYHGYPPNYLKIFQKEIEAVTLPQIKDILAIYFFPEKLKIMIVGDRAKIKDLNQLEGFVEIPLDDE